MFYFLSKTLPFLITPASWLFFALLGALFLRNPRLKRRFVRLALVVFWLLGNGPLVNEAMRTWEINAPDKAINPDTTQKKVAVVLTGGMINVMFKPDPLRPVLGSEADRAGQALWLYQTGRVQRIVISGGDPSEQGKLSYMTPSEVDEGQMVRTFLLTAGVPPDAIILENQSRNTHENALFSARVLRQRLQTTTCVLVTSAWHMRRAEACFRRQGIEVSLWPSAGRSERSAVGIGAYLLPSEKAFHDAQVLIREVVGFAAYWVAGYV